MTSISPTRPLQRQWHLFSAAVCILLLLLGAGFLLSWFHRSPPAPPSPAWRLGNQYFQRVTSHDWIGTAALCKNAACAQAAQTALEPLIDQYGPLRGYGSSGSNADLPKSIKQTSQDYQLIFERRNVGITVYFVRERDTTWKVARVQPIP